MFPYRLRRLILLLLLSIPATEQARAQAFTVYDSMQQLESRIQELGSTNTIVIKFWATWCKPCIEELPLFEKLHERYARKNVHVLLVSLDFKSELDKKFIPFLQNAHLKPEVILFADQDANTWIPRIHEAWDGAIPATVVLRGNLKSFHLGKFDSFEGLESFVLPFVEPAYAPRTPNPRP